jgi:hypothetical protein
MPALMRSVPGAGSDRVSTHATVEIAKTLTRSLPLPALTSSQIKIPLTSKAVIRLALTALGQLPIISNFAPGPKPASKYGINGDFACLIISQQKSGCAKVSAGA